MLDVLKKKGEGENSTQKATNFPNYYPISQRYITLNSYYFHDFMLKKSFVAFSFFLVRIKFALQQSQVEN